MKRIRITDTIPASGLAESESARIALVGAELAVDTDAVHRLRDAHSEISPKSPDTYEATLNEVLGALHQLGRVEAATDWSIIAPCLVRIPLSCAERIASMGVIT